MNKYLDYSIAYAQQRSYLDDLFSIYPTIPEGLRDIDHSIWIQIEDSFKDRNNEKLIKNLLKLDLFPIKDSYVAYLRRDPSSVKRNPRTINRLAGRIYDLGLDKLYERCSEPKETNRKIGPLFNNWIESGSLGIQPQPLSIFENTTNDSILSASDAEKALFAKKHLNYHKDKGLDFLARFNGKYVIGEAKFLTDFGGHQNAQFEDAISTITQPNLQAVSVAILDGVLYIKGKNKLYKRVTSYFQNENIMSALVLREFLYSL